jgi:hypothetical protein
MTEQLVQSGNPITGDLAAEVRACRQANLPMLVFGAPGVGKSQQICQASDPDDLVIDLRLNSLESIDMRGLPVIKKDDNGNPVTVEWVRPEFLPSEAGIIVQGKKYTKGILFLDELNTALPSVQNPALQLVLDRRIGSHFLGKDWYICAAANRSADGAHTYPLSSALLDRFVIYDYSPNYNTWVKWAIENKVHNDVVGYISFSPGNLLVPRKDEHSPSANPRSWVYVSKRLHLGQNSLSQIRACVGTVASEFCAYMKVCESLPDIPKLVEGKVEFEENKKQISISYAVANALASHLLGHEQPTKMVDKCVNAVQKISPEPASLFFRRIMLSSDEGVRKKLFESKEVSLWIQNNREILQGAMRLT